MSPVLEELAGELKRLREAKHLSQRELAARVGMRQSHISKIETGQVNLGTVALFQIARALEHDVMLIPREEILSIKALLNSKRTPSSELGTPAYHPDEDD